MIDEQSATVTAPSTVPHLFDWRQACAALGGPERPISRATLDRLTRAGIIKVVRPAPGVVRWAAEDLREYLESVRYPRNGKAA